jgi:hypothetical protein
VILGVACEVARANSPTVEAPDSASWRDLVKCVDDVVVTGAAAVEQSGSIDSGTRQTGSLSFVWQWTGLPPTTAERLTRLRAVQSPRSRGTGHDDVDVSGKSEALRPAGACE